MSLAGRFAAAIRRAGEPAVLLKGEERLPLTASIQPVGSGTGESSLPLGYGTAGQYDLYCVWDNRAAAMEAGDEILCGDRLYTVRRVETHRLEGKALYRWASLTGTGRGPEA